MKYTHQEIRRMAMMALASAENPMSRDYRRLAIEVDNDDIHLSTIKRVWKGASAWILRDRQRLLDKLGW